MVVQSELGKGSAMPTDPHHTPTILQSSLSQPKKTHKPRKPTRKVTQVPQPSDPMEHVANEAVHKELGHSLVSASTNASSLEAEHDNGNINKTQSKAIPNEPSSQGTNSGGGPRCQETIRNTTAQTRFESVSKHSNDSLLVRGNTLQSDEDRLKLNELMVLCTNLQTRVLDLEKIKTTQCHEIASLKRRVKKLEKKNRSRTHKLKRLYKVGLTARVESSRDEESLGEDASKQERRIDAIDQDEDITLTSKPKVKGIVIHEQEEPGKSTTTTTIPKLQLQDKGKGIMIKEHVKAKKKDQIRLDEEAAKRDDIQAKIDVDHQLTERLQVQEQEELFDAKKDILFQQLLEKRRKNFASKRAEEKRNKPPTQAQKRKIMCTYLKNMEGYKLKQLKPFEFDKTQEMFDRAFKRINTFEPIRSKLVERIEKRPGEALIQESTKKQKVEDDKC
uniref:Uncharacterized protein n=1 Tax=Tanacetum cinerariifolium TaxID=118510 RepID=A0A699GN04_TANCI|nr:hypothetical protein [Tanacetum cinerariifolium]